MFLNNAASDDFIGPNPFKMSPNTIFALLHQQIIIEIRQCFIHHSVVEQNE